MTELQLLAIIAASTAILAGAQLAPLVRRGRNWAERQLRHHRHVRSKARD